jgi:hypothetical protein
MRGTRGYRNVSRAALCAGIVALGAAQDSFAQADAKPPEEKPTIILNKPAETAAKLDNDAGPGRVRLDFGNDSTTAAPAGVLVTAPDEEIIIEGKPKIGGGPDSPDAPPMVRRKVKIEKGDRKIEGDVEQRLARLERMIERLTERETEGAFAFNDKQFGKLQKDLNRATREADIAVKRMEKGNPEFGKNFTFEHKIAIAGSAKAQKKALEAQRKALQKQMEAIDKRIESLKDAADDDGDVREEKSEEHQSEISKESSTSSDKQ